MCIRNEKTDLILAEQAIPGNWSVTSQVTAIFPLYNVHALDSQALDS